MFYGISHVDVPVRQLARARHLYTEVLGFPVVKEGEGWIDVDGGAVRLRLYESRKPERVASIRVQARDIEEAVAVLEKAGGRVIEPPARTDELTMLATVSDVDGNTLTIWRELSEDEYGFDPDLPKHISWDPDAEVLLKGLLKGVPAIFRGLARGKVVREAEGRAERMQVTRDVVIRSFISSNAKITRYRARQPLLDNGIDPDAYSAEFEAE